MLIFDQLRKNDLQLQLLALVVCAGLGVLLIGLWWVQVVTASRYQESLETQSIKTVRVPGVRGKIFDRNGVVLADNKPSYNINLCIEDLRSSFQAEYKRSKPRKVSTNDLPFWKDWLGVSAVKTQNVPLTAIERLQLQRDSRYSAVNRVVTQLGDIMKTPLTLDYTNFYKHFEGSPAMPYPLASNLSPAKLASFTEQSFSVPGVDLEIQPQRFYPNSNLAAHVLGYVSRKNESVANEVAYYDYRLQDFKGEVGVEGGQDTNLRGAAGEKAVTINNLGYRRSESWVTPVDPGKNAYLTIDLRIQAAAETALRTHAGFTGRGAVVVMDVWSGDVLAMASWPTYDPNWMVKGFTPAAIERWKDEDLAIRLNRAASARYQAGSVFKTVVALAALETPEARFSPNEIYHVMPNPQDGSHGIYIGKNFKVRDTVHPGDYNLRRAISQSSNAYFVSLGLRPGVFQKVIELAEQLHFGERIGLGLMQEFRGDFPPPERLRNDGDKANVCIGGGEMSVTPCQVAVLISAIANGGKVLNPRVIDRLESQDPIAPETTVVSPKGESRGQLSVSKRSFEILRDAMLDETESEEGTGKRVVGCGFRVCGKTGTAERNERTPEGRKKNTTWFASFAPYESPRYAVVVAVENGVSGGSSCVPIARDVYIALKQIDAEYTSRNLITKR